MAQNLFGTLTSPSLPLLDANFTELYGFSKNMVSDASGNCLFGGKSVPDLTTSGAFFEAAGTGYGRLNVVKTAASGTGATPAMAMYYAGVQVGKIDVTSTSVSFFSASDRRLKTGVQAAASFGAVIDAIEVVSFNWISGGAHSRAGFIAQDLYEVVPEAVSVGDAGEQMSSTWAVDASKLIPFMIRELQDLRARVALLEA